MTEGSRRIGGSAGWLIRLNFLPHTWQRWLVFRLRPGTHLGNQRPFSSSPCSRSSSLDSFMFWRIRKIAKIQPQRIRNGILIMKRILMANAVAVWSCIPSLQVGHANALLHSKATARKQIRGKHVWRKLGVMCESFKLGNRVETTSRS